MSAASLAFALLLSAPSEAAELRFQRVDLISEVPGSFLNHDLPMAGLNPVTTGLRWVEQIQVVVDLPVEGLSTGVSIGAQSLFYERALVPSAGLSWGVGLQTDLLLPKGALVDASWRWKRLRLGLGFTATSSATWAHPNWSAWQVLPTAGIGLGRAYQARP
jgi:hypothetical protein